MSLMFLSTYKMVLKVFFYSKTCINNYALSSSKVWSKVEKVLKAETDFPGTGVGGWVTRHCSCAPALLETPVLHSVHVRYATVALHLYSLDLSTIVFVIMAIISRSTLPLYSRSLYGGILCCSACVSVCLSVTGAVYGWHLLAVRHLWRCAKYRFIKYTSVSCRTVSLLRWDCYRMRYSQTRKRGQHWDLIRVST